MKTEKADPGHLHRRSFHDKPPDKLSGQMLEHRLRCPRFQTVKHCCPIAGNSRSAEPLLQYCWTNLPANFYAQLRPIPQSSNTAADAISRFIRMAGSAANPAHGITNSRLVLSKQNRYRGESRKGWHPKVISFFLLVTELSKFSRDFGIDAIVPHPNEIQSTFAKFAVSDT